MRKLTGERNQTGGRRSFLLLVLALFCLLPGFSAVAGELTDRQVRFVEQVAQLIQPEPSIRGEDPQWFFLSNELRHLATGAFWTQPWEEVAVNQTDPLPSILEFSTLLKEKGVRLIVAAVPPKAALYPDRLHPSFQTGDAVSPASVWEMLEKEGVEVLDLEQKFLAQRTDPSAKLYCEQDAHFSPLGARLVAEYLADLLGGDATESADWRLGETETLSITGDQVKGTPWEGQVAREALDCVPVYHQGRRGVEPDAASPVVLLGDSHTLVFHAGGEAGMHCTGAGVMDHLSYRLGHPVDLVGVRGSGLVQARKQLYYRASGQDDYWEGKKAVVWLFSVRELTQSQDRLMSIPLGR